MRRKKGTGLPAKALDGRNPAGPRLPWKRLALAGLALALLACATGCIKPDKTMDEAPTDDLQVLPFETVTPSPSPDPNATVQAGATGGTGETGTVVVTAAPTATPTIQVITPSPSPVPSRTPTPSPKPTDDGTLRSGSSGTAVRQLQQRLKELGYYTGSVDGDFGSGTEAALRAFQSVNGLTVDGVAGTNTLSKLTSSSAQAKSTVSSAYATSRPTPLTYTPSTLSKYRYLQLGSTGSDVTRLQQRLAELGYFHGAANGSFGADTEAAVKAFQQRNGCYVDGVAGEDTQGVLFSSAALAYGGTQVNTSQGTGVYRTMRLGMSGEDVQMLQSRLKELYYYNGSADGNYGTTTELAVKVFQQRNGLTVDGVAGSGTQSRLYSAAALYAPTAQPSPTAFKASGTLQTGSAGEEVYRLQERLYDLGYYTDRIDGVYTEAVATAVRAFQAANSLTVDGKAGANTQTKLFSASAIRAKSAADDSFATLREGDSGERVRALQALLSTYGYYAGAIDGKYGPSTTTAVQQFQSQNGLKVDGVAGPATQQLLYLGKPKHATTGTGQSAASFATLRQGMSGMDVMQMQQYLADYGYYYDTVDGVFGYTTMIAVQAFQSRNGLVVDGVAGQATLALLYSGDGLPAQGYTMPEGLLPGEGSAVGIQPGSVVTEQRETLRQGDEGQDVFDLQHRLKELGYFSSEPDGKYGSATTASVKSFQTRNGLKSDGVAGPATRTALYVAGVRPAVDVSASSLGALSNRNRELEEQNVSGAIQGSLAGGGVAASYNSVVYYAGGSNAALCVTTGGREKTLYAGPVAFIHASAKGVTFVSGGKILRVPTGGGDTQTLMEAGRIEKLSLVRETMYYLEGDALVKAAGPGDATVLARDVRDFTIDVFQMTAYIASETGVRRMGLTGGNEQLLVSTAADQVQICDSVLFYRSGGSLYRVENGISVLLMNANATWMGIYREKVYYINEGKLYRCDTNGQNTQIFYDGPTAGVSFVAGRAYIAQTPGGAVKQVLPVE